MGKINMKKIIIAMLILASCTKEETQNSFKTITPIETKQFIFNTYSRDANNTIVNDSEIYSSFVQDYQFVRTMAKGDSIRLEVVSNMNQSVVKLNIVDNGLIIFRLQGVGRIKHTFKYE
jgi:uncharacterized membrane-anchored protein YhcB (DUF1043 family)